MISWRRVDKNGLWDEMHCENNVKNFACQIPVGNKSRKDFSKHFNGNFNERIFSSYFQFVKMGGHGQKVCASGDAYILFPSQYVINFAKIGSIWRKYLSLLIDRALCIRIEPISADYSTSSAACANLAQDGK